MDLYNSPTNKHRRGIAGEDKVANKIRRWNKAGHTVIYNKDLKGVGELDVMIVSNNGKIIVLEVKAASPNIKHCFQIEKNANYAQSNLFEGKELVKAIVYTESKKDPEFIFEDIYALGLSKLPKFLNSILDDNL